MNGSEVLGSTPAIFDTGTTQILGDSDGIKKLFEKVPGAQSAPQFGDGTYTSALRGAVT